MGSAYLSRRHAPPYFPSEPPRRRSGTTQAFAASDGSQELAYCEKLVFTTASNGEPLQTELTFNAAAIRQHISPTATGHSETAAELFIRLTKHRQVDRTPGPPFFEVKLIGVDPKACPFLDVDQVRMYLRQVAPVEFNMQAFVYGRSKINPLLESHNAKKTINLILVHDGRQEQITKPYRTYHEAGTRSKKHVEIIDIEIQTDRSIPPLWVGWLSKARDLTGTINSEDVRGIRLRANNIQIGDHRTFARILRRSGRHLRALTDGFREKCTYSISASYRTRAETTSRTMKLGARRSNRSLSGRRRLLSELTRTRVIEIGRRI